MLSQHSNGPNRLTKIDSELAHLRGLLEKKYSNDHNSGYTYIDPVTSDSILLTSFMMKEWACTMVSFPLLYNTKLLKIDMLLQYNDTVSVSYPPSTPTFDSANHRPSLQTCHYHSESVSAPISSGVSGNR
jgi:hypothetical protein